MGKRGPQPLGYKPDTPDPRRQGRLKGDMARKRRTINATDEVWTWVKSQHPQGASDYLQRLYDESLKTH
jgi:hypothetical protein